MTRTVEVTQQDICDGLKRNCQYCPLSLAMTRAFGEAVEVGFTHYWKHDNVPAKRLPEIAIKFRTEFDQGWAVAPIKFEIAE